MSFFKVASQCCDAGSYIAHGTECATDNVCYGPLRPVGDYLWFSIPPRMGWPTESLITANFMVTAVGVLLSVMALRKLLAAAHGVAAGKVFLLLLFLLSSCIHGVFLQPTIFNTLSDPPANMMLLGSVWLLILTYFNSHTHTRIIQFFLAGLCLGLAAWLRAFYLYPVLAGVAIYTLLWFFSSKKSWSELLLLIALLPIGTQYFVMHKVYGTYSYLEKESTNSWTDVHLNNPYIGFDTIFPRNGYFWPPQHCEAKMGILNGLSSGNFKDVACVVTERLYFYLGTYEPDTYIFSGVKNQLPGQYAEKIGDLQADWFPQEITFQADVEMAPSGQKTADKLTVTKPAADGEGDVVQWIQLRGNTAHTFSVWLWSPKVKTINLTIKRHYDDKPIALQQFTLSPVPTRYAITGTTIGDDLYDVNIGRTPYPADSITFGTEAGDFFYAWGAQLEVGDKMTAYDGAAVASPDSVRVWHPELLVLNCFVLLLSAIAFTHYRVFWFGTRMGISIITIFLVAAAECTAIIPEQRFSIGLMIFFWLIASTFFLIRIRLFFKNHTSRI